MVMGHFLIIFMHYLAGTNNILIYKPYHSISHITHCYGLLDLGTALDFCHAGSLVTSESALNIKGSGLFPHWPVYSKF